MSKPKGKRAATATQPRSPSRTAMSLTTCRQMIPLVSHIVKDVQHRWNRLSLLEAEQNDLDKRRHRLDWPGRARRYQIADDITVEQRGLQEAAVELEQLSLVLVDPLVGEIAFPTIINGRKAYFVWKLNDADVSCWCYCNDPARRAIPPSWRREG